MTKALPYILLIASLGLMAGVVMVKSEPNALPKSGESPPAGDDVAFESQVDKKKTDTDGFVTLTITAKGSFAQNPQIKLPDLAAFEVASQAQRYSVTTRSGKQEIQSQIQLVLRPLDAGKRTIGPCELIAKGKTYTTQSIDIDVAAGTHKREPEEPSAPGGGWQRFRKPGQDVTI